MSDSVHDDLARDLIELEEDSIIAAPGAPQPGKFTQQGLTEPSGVLGQRAEHELDDRWLHPKGDGPK